MIDSPRCFADIDGDRSAIYSALPPEKQTSLLKWVEKIQAVPFTSFEALDLSRSIRQDMHREVILPYALTMLESDPLAGENYDGELVGSLVELPASYWSSNPDARTRLAEIIRILPKRRLDAELFRQIERLIALAGLIVEPDFLAGLREQIN